MPLIAVHLFVFYFGIMADVTPPVGLAAYAAAGIAKADPMKTGFTAFWYVITSYSIHYTKLYDGDVRSVRGAWNANQVDPLQAQHREQVPIAGVVDKNAITRFDQITKHDVECVHGALGEDDLARVCCNPDVSELGLKLLAQRPVATRGPVA